MKRRILHITTGGSVGGIEKHILSIIKGLSNKYEFTVTFFNEMAEEASSMVPLYKGAGAGVVNLEAKRKVDFYSVCRLLKLIKKGKFDLLHVHSIQAGLLGGIFARLLSIPVIATLHNMEEALTKPNWALLTGLVYRKFSRVICISKGVRKFVLEKTLIPPNKCEVVYYGIDIRNTFSFAGSEMGIRNEFGISENTLLIGTVARLAPQKGHKYLIHAAPKIRRKISNFHILFVGHDDRSIRMALEGEVKRLGVDDLVTFAGFRDDISNIISSIDLFVLPSLWEGFGLVLLEAMQAGKPTVATNVGPIPEVVINGETGLLVPPENAEELAEAIVRLAEDRDLACRMGEAGKKRLEDHFSLKGMLEQIEAIYEEVLEATC